LQRKVVFVEPDFSENLQVVANELYAET